MQTVLRGIGFYGFLIVLALTFTIRSQAQITAASTPQPRPSPGTILSFPSGINNQAIAIDPSGNLWISSSPSLLHLTKPGQEVGIGNVVIPLSKPVIKWVPDSGVATIIEMSPSGTILRSVSQVAPPDWAPGQWWGGQSIAFDPSGNVYVPFVVYFGKQQCGFFDSVCYYKANVQLIKVDSSGAIAGNFNAGEGFSDEWTPRVVSDSKGAVYVSSSSDRLNAGVLAKVEATGIKVTKLHNKINRLAVDGSDNVWETNTVSDDIYGMSPAGAVLGPIHTHHGSTGIAIDKQGNFWIGGNAHEIEKISPAGEILTTTPIQNNTGDGPRVIKIDGAGNVWAVNQSDKPNQGSTVVELNPQGVIMAAYPMPNATDLAIDKQGNVWVTNALTSGNNLYEIVGAAAGTP